MIDGAFSSGQGIRSVKLNSPAGAGSQFARLSLPGEFFASDRSSQRPCLRPPVRTVASRRSELHYPVRRVARSDVDVGPEGGDVASTTRLDSRPIAGG
jgi:hypothetical protein